MKNPEELPEKRHRHLLLYCKAFVAAAVSPRADLQSRSPMRLRIPSPSNSVNFPISKNIKMWSQRRAGLWHADCNPHFLRILEREPDRSFEPESLPDHTQGKPAKTVSQLKKNLRCFEYKIDLSSRFWGKPINQCKPTLSSATIKPPQHWHLATFSTEVVAPWVYQLKAHRFHVIVGWSLGGVSSCSTLRCYQYKIITDNNETIVSYLCIFKYLTS